LVKDKSATGVTLIVAVAVLVFVPTLVLKEPEGMVFVSEPGTEVVTTTDTEQPVSGGIKVPAASVREFDPIDAVTEPRPPTIQVVVCAGVEKLNTPAG
jgi:hypothetical protein